MTPTTSPPLTQDELRSAFDAVRRKVYPPSALMIPSPITEEMHQAACKVLTRASGLDGTPQRMLDALAAAAANPINAGHTSKGT